MTTIFESLTDQARRMGDRPAVVFADATTSERTELGFATLHNWVSKTANLLLDAFDAGLGSEVRVDLPLHWMAPVVALGAWATGAATRVHPGGDVHVGHEADGLDVDLVVGAGMGGRPLSQQLSDALTVTDVLAQPDEFVDHPDDEGAWAVDGRSQATLLADPLAAAPARVLHHGDRVDVDVLVLLARTLPHGVGVVLARGYDADGLERLAEQEGAA